MRIGTLRHSGCHSSAALFALSCFAVSGCAIHPLPEDVARLDTIEIVDHIRCEMYDALRHQVVIGFQLSDSGAAHQVAREIESHPDRSLRDFLGKVELLKSDYKNRFGAFRGTTIGYGFRFNITEQDVATADLSFGLPWNPLANFGLKTGAGIDKRRANTRRFFKVETFEELLLSNDCLGKTLNEANIVYPITGKIGLRKVVEDFIKLTTRGAKTFAEFEGRQELLGTGHVRYRNIGIDRSEREARARNRSVQARERQRRTFRQAYRHSRTDPDIRCQQGL